MSEKVECPFCDTEVIVEYLGGMTFGSDGVVGGRPLSEGSCPNCEAHVSVEAALTKAGKSLDILVLAHTPSPPNTSDIIRVLKGDDVKSYAIREGVRIP